MTTFSPINRETNSADVAEPADEPSIVRYRPAAAAWPAIADNGAARTAMALPKVVLSLPDRTTALAVRPRPGRLRDRLSWIGIGAGALVALALIWTGKKPTEHLAAEDAPTWTGNVARSLEGSAPNWQPPTESASAEHAHPSVSDGSAAPRASDASAIQPQEVSGQSDVAPAAPDGPTGPVLDGAAANGAPRQSQSPDGLRTARNTDTHWDGRAGRMPPGQAAPTGITNSVRP